MVILAACLGGCSASGTGAFSVPEGRYADAFVAARDVLRDARFTIERVDAAAGVITTSDKASSGWATPWDADQTTLWQESSDLFNQQRRRVRVVFDPPDAPTAGHVEVSVVRLQVAGLRLNPRSVQLTTTAVDPALRAQGIWNQYELPVTRDGDLEARLARQIERRLERRVVTDTP